MLLAGDIGGTKTRLGVFAMDKEPKQPIVEATFASADYSGLEDIIQEFIKKFDFDFKGSCFGVAGPVVNGRCTITNLSWVIDEHEIQQLFKIPRVHLINDLKAIASAIPLLTQAEFEILNPGQVIPRENIALVAPGTGLGQAFLTWNGNRYHAHASEGGHTDFGPINLLQAELLSYLLQSHCHVSYEKVCSGIGILNLYRFLKDTGKAEEPVWLSQKISGMSDPVPLIVNTALDDTIECNICQQTLDLFVSILGAETGNFALKTLPRSGIYLCGGIPPRIRSFLRKNLFMQAFLNKGRMRPLLELIPIYIILNPSAALTGAAVHGLEMF